MPLQSSSVPVPDPTALTTAAVDRATITLTQAFEKELSALKELTDAKLYAVHNNFETRDVAVKLLADDVKLISAKIQQEVASQAALLVEKQNVIKADMAGMKELATALKSAADAGINAAFLAADKVVQSQYTAFKDTLDKTNDSIVLRIAGIERALETMRDESLRRDNERGDRITRLETAKVTASEVKTENRLDTGQIIAYVVAAVAVIGFFISFETSQTKQTVQTQPAAIAVAPIAPSALAPR